MAEEISKEKKNRNMKKILTNKYLSSEVIRDLNDKMTLPIILLLDEIVMMSK